MTLELIHFYKELSIASEFRWYCNSPGNIALCVIVSPVGSPMICSEG
jgi:hypothetical protein